MNCRWIAWKLAALALLVHGASQATAQANPHDHVSDFSVTVADTSAQPDPIRFQQEMELANKAPDRDSRVDHLRNALSCRPDDPNNLAIEFQIAIELSQRSDPDRAQFPQRREALPIFERIVRHYKHMDYYSAQAMNGSDSQQLMVPQSAILAACLERGLNRDSARARAYLLQSMEMLKQSHDKRIEDWKKEPAPRMPAENDPFNGGVLGMSKAKSRVHSWEQRQKRAAEGDVFGPLEMATVQSAVRQFGYTYGPQTSTEVPIAMNEIIKRFPGTPMAKIAQGHIHRAAQLTEKYQFAELPADLEKVWSPDDQTRQPNPTTQSATVPVPAVGAIHHPQPQRWFWPATGAVLLAAVIALVLTTRSRSRLSQSHDAGERNY